MDIDIWEGRKRWVMDSRVERAEERGWRKVVPEQKLKIFAPFPESDEYELAWLMEWI